MKLTRIFISALTGWLLSGPALVAAAQTGAAGVSAYVTLTSDYRSRGLSQSDEKSSLQIGVDYQHDSGFFAGGWASNVDYVIEGLREKARQTEVDYYVGYDWRREDWSLTCTLVHYTYPGFAPNYDYSEISSSVGFRDRIFLSASYTNDLLSQRLSAFHQELRIALPLSGDMELGAELGRFESTDIPGSRYTHWNIGVSKVVRRFSLDLRFYDNTYDVSSYLGLPTRDQWVLSASYGFQAR